MTVDGKVVRPRRRRRWAWLVVAVIVVAAAAAAGYLAVTRRGQRATASPPVTTTVHLVPFQVTVSGPGTLSPARTVALTPAVAGRVLTVAAIGDRVSQGQVVATLDPAGFQRAVDDATLALRKAEGSLAAMQAGQAKATASLTAQIAAAHTDVDAAQRALDSQQRTLALTRTLYDMGSASASELQTATNAATDAADALASARTALDTLQRSGELQASADAQDLANARVAVQQARLTLAAARQDLANTRLVAPFAGAVSSVAASAGEPAGTGSALLTVVDDARVQLDAQIDESDVTSVAVGQRASVTLDALGERTFQGRVTAIAPTATLISNIPVFNVTVEVDNADRALRGGMTGQATIATRTVPATFRIPSRAVTVRSEGATIQVQRPDGSYAPTAVTVVGTSGITSVLSGTVPEGAVVLVSGAAGAAGDGPAAGGGSAPGGPGGQRRPGAVPFGPSGGIRTPRRLTGDRRNPR